MPYQMVESFHFVFTKHECKWLLQSFSFPHRTNKFSFSLLPFSLLLLDSTFLITSKITWWQYLNYCRQLFSTHDFDNYSSFSLMLSSLDRKRISICVGVKGGREKKNVDINDYLLMLYFFFLFYYYFYALSCSHPSLLWYILEKILNHIQPAGKFQWEWEKNFPGRKAVWKLCSWERERFSLFFEFISKAIWDKQRFQIGPVVKWISFG